jgi:hypothetical protein
MPVVLSIFLLSPEWVIELSKELAHPSVDLRRLNQLKIVKYRVDSNMIN